MVDRVSAPVSNDKFPLLGNIFEAAPAPVLEVPPLVGETRLPLPSTRVEVPVIVVAVSLPLAPPPDAVALPPPVVGLMLPLSVFVKNGLPFPSLLLVEFRL